VVSYNLSSIHDYTIFPQRLLTASASPFHFQHDLDTARVPATISYGKRQHVPLAHFFATTNTVAFLIIKDDVLVYEQYFKGFAPSSMSMSFSMTKAVLSMLIGCAIDDGSLHSIHQPVTDFVPELAPTPYGTVTIRHLLQMTSGMRYTESDNPFGIHPRFYYTQHLEDAIITLRWKKAPGTAFAYQSGNFALLGLLLSRALHPQTLTAYMQERLWEPLGMEFDGSWSLDHAPDGIEKTWCCLSATARDFAKLGRLYLQKGMWNGIQILSPRWIAQSTRVETTAGSVRHYQYGWWIMSETSGDFRAEGHLGQFLYVNPAKGVIIVRLGTSRGGVKWAEWKDVLTRLAAEVR
jgi:CubicO group peptidase (beta-lactamase class C family)